MSLDLPLGPLLIDLEGGVLTAREIRLLSHPLVGGIILFARNYQSPQQLAELVTNIRSYRPGLLVCVDQEGGRVQRFRERFTRLPAPGRLKEIAVKHGVELEDIATQSGLLMAYELRQFDVDLSFAPVADIDYGHNQVIADRAFGSAPGIAGSAACSYYAGMQQMGMAGVAKHFPGHGWVKEDTHYEVARDDRSIEHLEEDLLPFKMLLAAGIEGVMPAHVIYSAWDDKPAVQSPKIVERLLRVELGFNGCVVSDDLSMIGASEGGSIADRVSATIQAGCDLIMCCNHPDSLGQAIRALEALSVELLMSEVQCKRREMLKAAPVNLEALATLAYRAKQLMHS